MRADGLSLLVLLTLVAVACSASVPDRLAQRYKTRCGVDPAKTTNLVLTGMPKTGTTYLHLNVARALERMGFVSRPELPVDNPHEVCSIKGDVTLAFHHFYAWQMGNHFEIVDWAPKVVYIVRDEAQTFQSGYNYFTNANVRDSFRSNSAMLLARIADGNHRLHRHVNQHRPALGDTIFLVHFDQITSHCEAVVANVVLFLLGSELSPDFRCFDDSPSDQLKIAVSSHHKHYVDKTGKLLAAYRKTRVDWSEIFEFQALHTFRLDSRYKMTGIPKLHNITDSIF